MNELVEQLKSRVGLDDQKAQAAAETVIQFLKQRLPGPLASQLDSFVSGGGLKSAEEKLGGFLDKSA